MYKATARWLIRRSIARLNLGDYATALSMFADDGTLAFPGDNSWSNQIRPLVRGRAQHVTHRNRAEIEQFLRRYVSTGMQMVVEDILVCGPPWNTRAAVRVHNWAPDADGRDRYSNRAVLFVTTRWGKIRDQEDYEDTERAAAFDAVLESESEVTDVESRPSTRTTHRPSSRRTVG